MRPQRAHERVKISGSVRLFWEDERGQQHFCQAEAQDVSASGISVTLRQRVPLRAVVQVESVKNQVRGAANVRRCEQRGMNFDVGLEFVGGGRGPAKMKYT